MRPTKSGETWVYPKSAEVLRAARLRTIGDYIARRRQTVLQAIADRPILEECRWAERRRGRRCDSLAEHQFTTKFPRITPPAKGTVKHEESKTCREMTARRRQHRVAAEGARAMQRTFIAYGGKLRRVDRFKYLGRMLSYDDSDTPAIRRNLQQARAAWGRLSAVIAKEEVPPPVAGMFYQAVVAAVLLYGSESWVISAFNLRALEGFHVEAARPVEAW